MDNASPLCPDGQNYLRELLANHMRNMAAVWRAQTMTLQGMTVLATRQGEMLEGTIQRSIAARPEGRATFAGQFAWLKTTILEAQTNAGILSELAARDNGRVANALRSRMLDSLDEFKATAEHAIPENLTIAGVDVRDATAAQIDWIKITVVESQKNSNVMTELAGNLTTTLMAPLTAAMDRFKAALEHAFPEKADFTDSGVPKSLTFQPVPQS